MTAVTTRTQLINFLISKYNFKSYLELGVADGQNFINVNCQEKTGVDVGIIPNLKHLTNLPFFHLIKEIEFSKLRFNRFENS